jgi:hypothetical protein
MVKKLFKQLQEEASSFEKQRKGFSKGRNQAITQSYQLLGQAITHIYQLPSQDCSQGSADKNV